jgi:hypothetical protein
MTPEKRESRFARWEALGLDRIKADLNSGGLRFVGGSREVRELAHEWVRMKEAQVKDGAGEILMLKPSFYGMGVDLKVIWRKAIATLMR